MRAFPRSPAVCRVHPFVRGRATTSVYTSPFYTSSITLNKSRREAENEVPKPVDQESVETTRKAADPECVEIRDQFAALRDKYDAPKNTIVLAHGLLGFDELHLAGSTFPGMKYWRGITEALAAKGIEVITTAVPPSGTLERRAERLAESIAKKANGKDVNIIA